VKSPSKKVYFLISITSIDLSVSTSDFALLLTRVVETKKEFHL